MFLFGLRYSFTLLKYTCICLRGKFPCISTKRTNPFLCFLLLVLKPYRLYIVHIDLLSDRHIVYDIARKVISSLKVWLMHCEYLRTYLLFRVLTIQSNIKLIENDLQEIKTKQSTHYSTYNFRTRSRLAS